MITYHDKINDKINDMLNDKKNDKINDKIFIRREALCLSKLRL